MVDTPSTILLTREQSTGSNVNLWGGYLITTQRTTEQAAKGYQTLAVTGDATIAWTNYATGNIGQCARLKLTGTATGTLTFPSYMNFMTVENASTQSITIKCFAGTGVTLTTLQKAFLYCDGTDYYNAGATVFPSGNVTFAGQLKGVSTGTANTDATNYAQVTTMIAGATIPAFNGAVKFSTNDPVPNYLPLKLYAIAASGLTLTYAANQPFLGDTLTLSGLPLSAVSGGSFTTSFATGLVGAGVTPTAAYFNLTKSANCTITMPAAATAGDTLIFDIGGVLGVVTFALNGLKYYGSTVNPTSSGQGTQIFRYHSAATGWIDV